MAEHGTVRRRLTAAAGWAAAGFGAVHMAVAPFEDRGTLSRAWADGWWDTFRLDPPTTPLETARTAAFWRTFGSFGAPMLVLGSHLVWATRRQQRVPAWVGWVLVAWGAPLVTMLPRSPGWTIPIVGGLIIAGDADRPPTR